MSEEYGSINEPGKSRQSFSPPSPNQPPVLPERPIITSLDPPTAEIGGADFTLDVTGTAFSADSIINFAGHDEPTTFNEPDTLSTLVKPSLWTSAVTVQCVVVNGGIPSEPVDFEFTEPVTPMAAKMSVDPDDLEEEIEEEIEEGDIEPTHKGRSKSTHKRRK